jgi:hypothetical protein
MGVIMARMTCRCGEYLSNTAAPNDVQLRVYSDREWDKILENDIIEAWKFPPFLRMMFGVAPNVKDFMSLAGG